MRSPILNIMANNDFRLKVLERFNRNFIFYKMLNYDKNRDMEKVFQFFFLILNTKYALKTFL